jgi:PPK2 family polyphosphate:nucleotide phosphotransferase
MPNSLRKLASLYRCDKGASFRLADINPGDTNGIKKEDAPELLEKTLARLRELQEKLYADNRWAVLVVFQAMDAAGKDSAIKHVMRGLNAQGGHVFPFKAPSQDELEHDFLWRAGQRLPPRGNIHIFNRSHYEEVLVVRVRPNLLVPQHLPASCVGKKLWEERFEDINGFERHLTRSGTVVIKFFLHVSRDEQKKRFLERIDDPAKNWKFSMGDVAERKLWPRYMKAYEDMVRHTSPRHAPWHIVPADHKWFTRLVVATTMVETLEGLNLRFPKLDTAALRELQAARRALAKPAA